MNELLSFVDVPQDGVDVDVATSRAKRLRRGAQVDGDVVAVEVIGHHQRGFSIDACFERRRKPRVFVVVLNCELQHYIKCVQVLLALNWFWQLASKIIFRSRVRILLSAENDFSRRGISYLSGMVFPLPPSIQ